MEKVVMHEEVVIVGGGVAGLATALALKRVGIKSLVLERANELRVTGAALTLFPNAWIALESLGVAHKLTSVYKPFKGGRVTDVATGVTQETVLTENEGAEWLARGSRSVHRRALLEALLEELPDDTIRYSSKLRSIEKTKTCYEADSNAIILHLEDGTTIHAKVLIGCDGVHSVVSKWLGLKDVANSGRYAVRGVAVFPEGHGITHEMHQFVDKGWRFGFAPLTDTDVYWGIGYQTTANKEEEMAKGDPKVIQEKVLERVADLPQEAKDVIQHSDVPALSWAPLVFRYPWDLIFGKVSDGTITVAGDAMHPMTPDLGQGGCTALEDAVVLGRYIRNGVMSQKDLEKEIKLYVQERRWRSATMITASYISGWVQQSGGGGTSSSGGIGGWLMKFLRDTVFYKTLYRRIVGFVYYDCGKLPTFVQKSD
ncbi:monooxygenase 2-like [Papaver somniferum]|uniref:monooxygenase 2-like n=1 Tax=Papaver somniferum TaxID=3469 RepID=UPI000E7034F4|nr:monooxygenase 2-like [Papaver somniferum]